MAQFVQYQFSVAGASGLDSCHPEPDSGSIAPTGRCPIEFNITRFPRDLTLCLCTDHGRGRRVQCRACGCP